MGDIRLLLASEMRERMQTILTQGYPYFVAESKGKVVGYTYASHYRPRLGYRFTAGGDRYSSAASNARGATGTLTLRFGKL